MRDKNMIEKENEYFAGKVVEDEMQRALSYDPEHKSFRLWYVLNSVIMVIVHFIFMTDHINIKAGENERSPEMPPVMQVIILLFYGAGILSLALYNYRAANKGALNAFASKYQKGINENGEFVNGVQRPDSRGRLLAYFNLMLPAWGLGSAHEHYFAFFLAWLILAFAYEVFTIFCLKKNMTVLEKMTADEMNEEE